MRRRLVLLALVLDTLGAAAFAMGLPIPGFGADDATEPGRYALVAGACLEVTQADGEVLAGRPVAAELCAAG